MSYTTFNLFFFYLAVFFHLLLFSIADILLNFRTTFVSRKGEVVSNSKQIAINYFRGWFAVDLLAALPFDHLYASDLYDGEVSKLFANQRLQIVLLPWHWIAKKFNLPFAYHRKLI